VLIAGGFNGVNLQSAELFNPVTSSFEKLPAEMNAERDGASAALLHNGRVLVVAGYNEPHPGEAHYLSSAEETSVTTPTVTTASAASVGRTTATLNGALLSEAVGTTYFQYGTGTAYSSSTAHQSASASLSAYPVAAALGGLSPGTTYHFRLVAENAGGASYGADRTFTTAAPAVTPIAAPRISSARQSASRWREGSMLAQISKRRKRPPLGTTFSFSLNDQATVTFIFAKKSAGRNVGHTCFARNRRNRTRKHCTHTSIAGELSFTGHAGTNEVFFEGRISPAKKLKPGRYTLIIDATNSAGRSAPARLSFTIAK
jgi:hypothetical protein